MAAIKSPVRRRTELEIVNDAIDDRLQKAEKLDSEILRQQENERAAVEQGVANPAKPVYLRGQPAYEAREKLKKLREQRELAQLELDALYVRRRVAEADHAIQVVDDKRRGFAKINERLEAAYREAAELFEGIVAGPWVEIAAAWEEYGELAHEVERGGMLKAAEAVDPAAGQRWRQAAAPQFGPMPTNVMLLFHQLALAAFNPRGEHDNYAIRSKIAEVVPDLREHNLPLEPLVKRDVMSEQADFNLAHLIGHLAGERARIELKQNPPPAPEPTAEQIANEAARAASVQRQWDARMAKQKEIRDRQTPLEFRIAGEQPPTDSGIKFETDMTPDEIMAAQA